MFFKENNSTKYDTSKRKLSTINNVGLQCIRVWLQITFPNPYCLKGFRFVI